MPLSSRYGLFHLFAFALPLTGQAQNAPPAPLRTWNSRDLPSLARTVFHFGPSGSLNAASVRLADPGYSPPAIGYRTGGEAGFAGNWARGHWALQAGARYARRGYTQRDQVVLAPGTPPVVAASDYQLNYLAVPVSAAYTQFANGQGMQVYAGVYAARFMAGRYEKSDLAPGRPNVIGRVRAADVQAFSFGGTEYVRPWDAGLQAGVGYRYGAALLQAGYAHGLRSLAPNTNVGGGRLLTGAPYYNQTFSLSLTYFAFGPRD